MAKSVMWTWAVRKERIGMSPQAHPCPELRAGGRDSGYIQDALNQLEGRPPVLDEQTITIELPDIIRPMPAAELSRSRERIWAVYSGHSGKRPGLSPFVSTSPGNWPMTNLLTVKVVHTASKVLWVGGAHWGEPMPPLPWTRAARRYPNTTADCASYWARHAYGILYPGIYVKGTVVQEPPNWWLKASG